MPDQAIPVEAEFTLLKKQLKEFKVRASARYRCGLATLGKLVFPETGQSQEAWIRNLSEGGAGLNLPAPLEVGIPLVIQLRNSPGDPALRLPARVIHSTQEADGTWRVGCEFESPLDDDALEKLL
jgi:hypothetical protein